MRLKISYYWIIAILLLCATALSFLDRQVLSISIIRIKEDLGIGDVEYGFINSGFLVSYAVMFSLGGILIDRYGSRIGLGFSVLFWSLATSLHGLAQSAVHFSFFRFLLGAGEGGCFPGAVKAVTEWAPPKRQALVNGIAIGGSAIGAVIALPLCAFMLGITSWRWVFLLTGIVGFIWFLFWWLATRRRIAERYSRQTVRGKADKVGWKDLLKAINTKESRVFIIIRFLLDPIFYFYMFWIPKYLSDIKGLSLDAIGYITWIPFLLLGIANILGGGFSDKALVRFGNVNIARKLIMGIGAALTIPVAFVGNIHSVWLIIFVMSLAFFAHGLWITNYITSIGDVFGKSATSTIVGVSGTAGAISSMIINPLMGYIVSYSYTPLWVYAGIMYPVAFLILVCFLPQLKSRQEIFDHNIVR
jgi:ACS family hexuronate transporter-like MFS transporter